MSAWKQIALSIAIVLAAFVGWASFFPGAQEILARWGIDWAYAATPAADGNTTQSTRQGQGRGIQPTIVVTAPVGSATINDRLQAIGTGRANATVTVNPYTSGRLTEFLVQSGARVEKGQVLARLDSDTEEIALERAKIARDDAAAKVERFRALRASSTATAVQLTEAELALRNADLSIHDAQVALERRSIIAPIAGVVGILPIEAGNYVTSQSAVATIDDRSSILVDFWAPERFASAVKIGTELQARSLANPNEAFTGSISAVDNRIDAKSRTLWVQAKIANPADSLRAGMSFQVTMRFPGDTYPAVSPLAIQWGADGAFIWAVEDGKAKRVPVRIVQRNTEDVLVDAPITSGDIVVTEGVQSVREGSDVRIAGSEAPQGPETGGS
ncbi:RND family efflux transporter, MFP subunit [Mesorhizobium albiziae]|uniref:RND family efflux transporter, MFP subunit n=1 Tax=Neomesorhizobium albiziae TaxID=335020 RepID=A0A1I4A5E1_9HYPH|nr:efflux RND transporter periplasmic adaptor subunit [Mesorhizobium albiziae]GLS34045.1 hemolysin secretion protein D [Mesorhizobium albiziae]SFK51430.1 RND family efflux transporter, MFP subunit [Mesorhizobium albiziae]